MTDHTTNQDTFGRDPALDAIGNALEGRAESLRREPDPGFESRILRTSRVALKTGAELRFVEGEAQKALPRRTAPTRSPLVALAAGIALAMTAGLIAVVATRPAPVSPLQMASGDAADLLDELDAWLGMHDAHFADTRLVSLRSEVDSASSQDAADIFDPEEWM